MLTAWSFALVNALIFERAWPFNSFLFDPVDRFADLTNLVAAQARGDPYGDSTIMIYFPFTNVLLRPLAAVSADHGVVALAAVLVVVTFVLFFGSTAGLRSGPERIAVALVFLVSYPVVFALDRGNLEILTYGFLAGFALCWRRGRFALAAVLLSAAIAMKGTPLVFLAFLLQRQHRRRLLGCLALVLLETWIGLVILRPGLLDSVSSLFANLSAYTQNYAVGDAGHAFGHSLFGGVKGVVTFILGDEARQAFAASAFGLFSVLALLAHAGAVVYVVRRRPELWRGMAVLTCVTLLFTPVSADYRLLLLLVPCALFFAEKQPTRYDALIAMLFGLALIPKGFNFLLWNHAPAVAPTLSTILSPMFISGLLVAVLWEGRDTHDGAFFGVAPRTREVGLVGE